MDITSGAAMRVVALIVTAAIVSIGRGERQGGVEATGQGRADVRALLEAARGVPAEVCALAAQSLRNGWGNFHADAPVGPLGEARALQARDENLRRLPPESVDQLFAALAVEDPCVREVAIRLIGQQRETDVSGRLLERLRSADSTQRTLAALGLGYVEAPAAAPALLGALRDRVASVRANAAWALGRMEAGSALRPLTGLFDDSAPVVREAAVQAAGHMDSTSAAERIARVLLDDDVARVRRVAAWALGNLEARAGVQALAIALRNDRDASVREMSAWALGNMDASAGVEALRAALAGDADDRVRETAAWALAELDDRGSVEALSRAAESDRSARVRGTAAWALGEIRPSDRRAPAGLLRVLRDSTTDNRLKAAWALGNIGDSATVRALREALDRETSTSVRRALVRALVKAGGRSEEYIGGLLSSSDPEVREAVIRGLAGREAFNPWPWPQPRPRPFP